MSAIELSEEPDFWISPDRCGNTVRATVVIPSFCAEATLLRAVQSALGQSMRDIEVIIVDDASTDGSWQMITTLLPRDRRLRALRNKKNSGKSVAMNRALGVARGRWIAVLDADDWYDAGRLSALIAVGESRHADMVADNQFLYDTGAQSLIGTPWPSGPTDWDLSFDDFLSGSHAYETFNLGMLKPVVRADFVRRTGLSYEEKARHGQDFFYLLQFFVLGGAACVVDIPYYYYTQPFGTISRRWSHQARHRYDFQAAYNVNQSYVDSAMQSVTASQLRHLRLRTRRLSTLEHYYTAKDLLSRGKARAAAARVLRHPRTLGYALHRLLSKYFAWATPNVAKVAARSRLRRTQNQAIPSTFMKIEGRRAQ